MAKLVADQDLYDVLCEARYHTQMARDAWRRAAQLQRHHASQGETVLLDALAAPHVDPETAYRVLQSLSPVEMLKPRYRIALQTALADYLAHFGPYYNTSTFVDMVVATLFSRLDGPDLAAWYRERASVIEGEAAAATEGDR